MGSLCSGGSQRPFLLPRVKAGKTIQGIVTGVCVGGGNGITCGGHWKGTAHVIQNSQPSPSAAGSRALSLAWAIRFLVFHGLAS